ncbi:MAG: alanyl-tRNA editing protein [Candidatus Woesearchaeota archaeon]
METKQLYLDDSYKKDCTAVIIDIIELDTNNVKPDVKLETNNLETKPDTGLGSKSDNGLDSKYYEYYIVLDQTIFYPKSGGQSFDTGIISYDNANYDVIEVIKREGKILHKIKHSKDIPKLNIGQTVHCIIDWNRRHLLMRMHTAAHVIDAVLYADGKILATGNELSCDKSRIDFNMPDFSMEKVEKYISKANSIIEKNLEVKNYSLSKDEAFKIPGIVKLAGALPPDIPILRITEIVGLDIQADGGTHVRSLSEIGKIVILSIENKGKERKRICYKLIS